MTLATLIENAIGRLNRAGIPYMVTGSIASSYYGEPRATRDLDLVIDPDPRSLDDLVDGLIDDGFYVDRDVAREAFSKRTQFNAVAPDGLKIDFIIRKNRPFSVSEFDRRHLADLLGTGGYIASIEDLIIAKLLEWAGGRSERQERDVAGLLAVSGVDIDMAYLLKWINTLGLEEIWRRVSEALADGQPRSESERPASRCIYFR